MCGHPKVEHRGDEKCTILKCLCGQYKGAMLVGAKTDLTTNG
jgi:hypothetical protein